MVEISVSSLREFFIATFVTGEIDLPQRNCVVCCISTSEVSGNQSGRKMMQACRRC